MTLFCRAFFDLGLGVGELALRQVPTRAFFFPPRVDFKELFTAFSTTSYGARGGLADGTHYYTIQYTILPSLNTLFRRSLIREPPVFRE